MADIELTDSLNDMFERYGSEVKKRLLEMLAGKTLPDCKFVDKKEDGTIVKQPGYRINDWETEKDPVIIVPDGLFEFGVVRLDDGSRAYPCLELRKPENIALYAMYMTPALGAVQQGFL